MQWLQDKKNLPIVIVIFVLILGGVGFFFFKMMKPADPYADMGSGTDTTTSASAPDAPPVTTASVPVQTAPAPGAGVVPVVGKPMPKEKYAEDPFLPLGWKPAPKAIRQGPARLRIPYVPPVFLPPAPKVDADVAKYMSQPPRRVAGIIYSQRVSALLQTPDGWETVRPGDKLRDGTRVERIERDRVVLRTTDVKPRFIEVKLAAAAMMGAGAQPAAKTPSYNPGYSPDGNM